MGILPLVYADAIRVHGLPKKLDKFTPTRLLQVSIYQ